MWDKIAVSAALVAGAVALLAVITVILFVIEWKDNQHASVRLQAVRYNKTDRAA